MAKNYRTSRGEVVDMDSLRLANEKTIAVGNMKVNARGDELGKGGEVVRTRGQVMQEYHKLNTPVADNSPVTKAVDQPKVVSAPALKTPVVDTTPVTQESAPTEYVKPRGSFAGAIAEETEVTQELLEPTSLKSSGSGVTRI